MAKGKDRQQDDSDESDEVLELVSRASSDTDFEDLPELEVDGDGHEDVDMA